jgi:hypothetical protein
VKQTGTGIEIEIEVEIVGTEIGTRIRARTGTRIRLIRSIRLIRCIPRILSTHLIRFIRTVESNHPSETLTATL